MKKRILSIIILGIGVSFCSSEVWDITSLYNGSFTANSSSFDSYFPLTFSVKDTSIVLQSFCFKGKWYMSNGTIIYSLNSGDVVPATIQYSSGNYYCVDFPENFVISPGDSLVWKYWGYNSSNGPTDYSFDSWGYYGSARSVSVLRPVQVDGNNTGFFFIGNMGANIITYSQPSYIGPILIVYSNTSPIFKVNYGNTSYEYELDSDLSIYLKSPVIQNGNTFTYAGNTGLNLFYNGTSQRYSKSNLYLDSMYWFNNNIFTPICL